MSMNTAEGEARGAADFLFSLMEQAWNSADVESYSQLYAGDTGYVNRYGEFLQNRAEVAHIHTVAFAGRFKNSRLRVSTRRFRLIAPTAAVAHVDVFTSAAGADSPELRAIATVVLAKDETGWHIAALHVSDIAEQQ
jgi:uncharacterized protein (TIGR02246 family)